MFSILKGGRGGPGDFEVANNVVLKGNIKVEDNNTGIFPSFIVDNEVAEDLQIFKNRGPGDKFVENNVVGENLQCKENDPPFVGQPNVVGGNAEDQCGVPG